MSDGPVLIGRLTPAANLSEELVRRLPTEHEIMTATGVSRTVVREAISALRAQGLVVTRQGVGAFVSPEAGRRPFRIEPDEVESSAEVLHVMELRLGAEAEAAGLAAERRTSAQLGEIGRRLQAVGLAIGQGESAVDADFAFHKAIFAATGNPHFLVFLGRFIIPRQAVRGGVGSPDEQRAHLECTQKEHGVVVAAVRAREPEQAHTAARLHLWPTASTATDRWWRRWRAAGRLGGRVARPACRDARRRSFGRRRPHATAGPPRRRAGQPGRARAARQAPATQEEVDA